MKKGTSFKCFNRRTALLKFSLWTRSIIYAGWIGVYRRRRNVQRKFLSMIVITAGGEYIFYTLFKTDNVSGRALIGARAKCRRAYIFILIKKAYYLYGAYKGGSRRIYSSRLRLKMTSWSVASIRFVRRAFLRPPATSRTRVEKRKNILFPVAYACHFNVLTPPSFV